MHRPKTRLFKEDIPMSALQKNPYATIPEHIRITDRVVDFIENITFDQLPQDVIYTGKRCILDGLGLFVAGTDEPSVRLLISEALETGGAPQALLIGAQDIKVPVSMAARILGTAGHAHDWDDSQVSKDPDHVYGLLTHPTIPPLSGALAIAQQLGNVSGQELLLAFLTGFEVECKISEWMFSQHYKRGFHSSGTVGTFGAYAAAAKLLKLKGKSLRSGLGITASMAAGIRANFGTMTKPLHVGRSAENGVTAALLAKRGFEADQNALDGIWGFFAVYGSGLSEEKLYEDFGKPWSIIEPGVSIKPYPCGVLTHPTMDLMLQLVVEHNIQAEQIKRVTAFAGSNILNPIRYRVAKNHLEAKFCLSALLAMIAIARRAGRLEFKNEFICSDKMQQMQQLINTAHDPEIEAKGFDKMRSRIEIELTNGARVSGWANERYRGGPENPLSDDELQKKFKDCTRGLLDSKLYPTLFEQVASLERLDTIDPLVNALSSINPTLP